MVENNPINLVNPLGLQGGAGARLGCCGGKPFDPVDQCCVNGTISRKRRNYEVMGFGTASECARAVTAQSAAMAVGIGSGAGAARLIGHGAAAGSTKAAVGAAGGVAAAAAAVGAGANFAIAYAMCNQPSACQ